MGLLTAAERALLKGGKVFGARGEADFPIRFFHATGSDFGAIDTAKRGSNTSVGAAREAFWGAERPDMVEGYADQIMRQGGAPSMMPMRGRMENPLVVDAHGGPIYDAVPDRAFRAVLRDAREAGHDGVIFKNAKDAPGRMEDAPAGDVYAFFPDNTVRSIFAAFDPARRSSNDLMAGLGLGVLPASGLLAAAQRRNGDSRIR